LDRLRELCLSHLRDGDAAFTYAAQAYRTSPADEAVRKKFEATSEAALAFDRVLVLYTERVQSAPAAEGLALRRRIASIALERLGQNAVAVEQLRFILQAEPGDRDVIACLERIYRAEQRTRDLYDLLLLRLDHAVSDDESRQLRKELARLAEEALSDSAAAAEHYRALSELDAGDRDVLMARDRLATAAQRWDELSEVLEQR